MRGGAAEGDHAGHVDDRPLAALLHSPDRRAGEHRRGEDLDVDEFPGLVGRKLGQRHVVGDPGVVHQHRERLGRADLSDRVDARLGGQVSGDNPDLDVGVRISEGVQALLPTAHDHEVVAIGRQALGKGLADPGRRAGDECVLAHAVIPFPFVSGFILARPARGRQGPGVPGSGGDGHARAAGLLGDWVAGVELRGLRSGGRVLECGIAGPTLAARRRFV